MVWVVDMIGLYLAVRALLYGRLGSGVCYNKNSMPYGPHTRLNDLGLEGQFRHWYLIPAMGYQEHVSSESRRARKKNTEDKPYCRNRRFPGGHNPALSPCRLHLSANLSQRRRSPDLTAPGAKRHATPSPRDQLEGPDCGRKHAKIAAPRACLAALES